MGSTGALCHALGVCGMENNKNNMKRTNGVRASYDAFSYMYSRLPLDEVPSSMHPKKPLIVFCHRRLASFAEVR